MLNKENVIIDKANLIIQKYFQKLLIILISHKEGKNDVSASHQEICKKRKIDYDSLIECEETFLQTVEKKGNINQSFESLEKDDFEEAYSDSEKQKNENDLPFNPNHDVQKILEDFISPIKSLEIFSIFQDAFYNLKLTNQNWLTFIISKLDPEAKIFLNHILQIKKIEIEEDNKIFTVSRRLIKVGEKKKFLTKENSINTFNYSANENINTNLYFDY